MNNPAAGFLQNCNSTPFQVTDGGNPRPEDFPKYMVGDAEIRNRRSLRSLELLRGVNKITFADWQRLAFDAEVYWARQELPKFAAELEKLKASDPKAAEQVRPYLEHLLAWDGRITADSSAATCAAPFDTPLNAWRACVIARRRAASRSSPALSFNAIASRTRA